MLCAPSPPFPVLEARRLVAALDELAHGLDVLLRSIDAHAEVAQHGWQGFTVRWFRSRLHAVEADVRRSAALARAEAHELRLMIVAAG